MDSSVKACSTATAGLAILSSIGEGTGYGRAAAGLAVTGLGMGLAMPTALDAVLGALPPEQTGAGTAPRTVQQIGTSFGVAILGSILNNVYRTVLSRGMPAVPTHVRQAALSNVAGAVAVARLLPQQGAKALIRAAFHAYLSGMADVLLLCAGLIVVGAVLTLLFLPAHAIRALPATRSDLAVE